MERTIAPHKHSIKAPSYLPVSTIEFGNGSQLFCQEGGSQELVSLTIRLNAGSKLQDKFLTTALCKDLLLSGTKHHKAVEITEKIDFLGAYINTDYNQDFTTIQLFCMRKYFAELIPYLSEIIFEPLFPVEEFKRIIQKKKQTFLVNNEKVHNKSRGIFFNALFGDENCYGALLKEEHFDEISVEDIQKFHTKYYHASNMELFMAGKFDEEEKMLVEHYFGSEKTDITFTNYNNKIHYPKSKLIHEHKENALQSSIRLGYATFDAVHPDYFNMKIVSTILGGYFGSRLMKNIREDKGYTYGIGSFQVSLLGTGYFGISTEVGAHVTNNALDEIYKELNLLRTVLISEEELSLVKNYMLGNILKSADGIFNQAELFKNLRSHQLDFNHIHSLVDRIRSIQPEDVLAISNKYLDRSLMHEIVLGKIN